MKTRTFLGKLNVRVGEYENKVTYLVVANSPEAALAVLETQPAMYYGAGDEPIQDGGYFANDGEAHVIAHSLSEIGLATFLDLQKLLPVRKAPEVALPTADDLSESTQAGAQSLHTALQAKAPGLAHSDVLNALAASWGEKNWQVLKSKSKGPSSDALKRLLAAAEQVVEWADNEGCGEDLTVTSEEGVKKLRASLSELQSFR